MRRVVPLSHLYRRDRRVLVVSPDPRGIPEAMTNAPTPLLVPFVAVPFDWKASPPVPRAVAWKVLNGSVRLTYGEPVVDEEEGDSGGRGTLALLSPQTVDLAAGQSFVVWPGTAVLYRATMEGTHVDWCQP